MICPKCGTVNTDGATFCGSCGTVLPTIEQEEISTPQQPSTAQPNGPMNGGMLPPKNYMTEAVIVTVIALFSCCCSSLFAVIPIIIGIVAIVKANGVLPAFNSGNINKALADAATAKKLVIATIVIAIAITIIIWIFTYTHYDQIMEMYKPLFEQYGIEIPE